MDKKTHQQIGRASKRKGAVGERQLAKVLSSYGYDCRRGRQYCGGAGNPDVVGLPGVHIECKRVEKLNLYAAVRQAISDARFGRIPTVMHRKNNQEWLVTLRLSDFMEMYKETDLEKSE